MPEIVLVGMGSASQSRRIVVPTASPVEPGSNYVPGELITAAGGTVASGGTRSELEVFTTTVVSAEIVDPGDGGSSGTGQILGTTGDSLGGPFVLDVTVTGGEGPVLGLANDGEATFAGTGYAPGDIWTADGGTVTVPATVELQTTQVSTVVEIVNPGTGGTPRLDDGTILLNGAAGTSFFNARFGGSVGVTGSLDTVTLLNGGSYSVNPGDLDNFPCNPNFGSAPTGVVLKITMGAKIGTLEEPGDYDVPPNNPVFDSGAAGPGEGAAFQIQFSPGPLASIEGISYGGDYTTNPTDPSNEPVEGMGLSGAVVSVVLGVGQAAIVDGGKYTTPPNVPLAQLSSDGDGIGATFDVVYSGDQDVGAINVDENGSVLATGFKISEAVDTQTVFSDADFAFATLQTVEVTIAAGDNAALVDGGAEQDKASEVTSGNPGTLTGQLSVELRGRNEAGESQAGHNIQEIQIWPTSLDGSARAAVRADMLGGDP